MYISHKYIIQLKNVSQSEKGDCHARLVEQISEIGVLITVIQFCITQNSLLIIKITIRTMYACFNINIYKKILPVYKVKLLLINVVT